MAVGREGVRAYRERVGAERVASAGRPDALALSRLAALRSDFPILSTTTSRGRPLVYLDSAATSQKPRQVIEAVTRYYESQNANIHRGVYELSVRATALYDDVRERVARFLGADPAGVVFVRGATEGINLVAQSWGRTNLRAGDEVLVTGMEHHSNIVPWQLVAEQTGAVVRAAPVTDAGELDLDAFTGLLGARTRLVAVTHVSNALGTVNPVGHIVQLAHERGALVLVDGAQAAPHLPVDLAELEADFFVCSGHKMLGPTGIGVLAARPELLDAMPPWMGGGDMIATVSFEGSTWAPVPQKFEAGTPNIAGVVGLGAAVEYLTEVGLDAIAAREHELLEYATAQLRDIAGVRIIGTARDKASVLSFTMNGVHPHDVGTVLDAEGVAIRAGHHCCQPLMRRFAVPATARASFAFYNNADDVDALVSGLRRVREIFGG
ncbi:MAG: cysteine desulfurase [Gemmatimonadota bacterium]|nr:cysteine desulfurase [Gemmatimonadota bacterium]